MNMPRLSAKKWKRSSKQEEKVSKGKKAAAMNQRNEAGLGGQSFPNIQNYLGHCFTAEETES